MTTKNQEPVLLELAPLPRDKVGPFFLLGLDKDAGKEQIEAHWARRVIWARKNQLRVPLEDINWSRQLLGERERRPRFDAATLNADTLDIPLGRLQRRYGGGSATRAAGRPSWQPLDVEKPLQDYAPAAELPDASAVRAALPIPEVPQEVPAVLGLLDQLAREPLDPWALPE